MKEHHIAAVLFHFRHCLATYNLSPLITQLSLFITPYGLRPVKIYVFRLGLRLWSGPARTGALLVIFIVVSSCFHRTGEVEMFSTQLDYHNH